MTFDFQAQPETHFKLNLKPDSGGAILIAMYQDGIVAVDDETQDPVGHYRSATGFEHVHGPHTLLIVPRSDHLDLIVDNRLPGFTVPLARAPLPANTGLHFLSPGPATVAFERMRFFDVTRLAEMPVLPLASVPAPGSDASLSASEVLTSADWTWAAPVDFLKSSDVPASDFAAAYAQLTDVAAPGRVYEIGQAPQRDLMLISRSDDDDGWSAPVSVGEAINTPGDEASPCLSADGLTLIFESDRPGGLGETDLWMSQRASLDAAFAAPVNLGPNVNSPQTEGLAALSADGLKLIFASSRTGSDGPSDLWICRRTSVNDPWSKAENLGAPVNSSDRELSPLLSSDGLVLLFASDRPGGVGGADVWMSQRATVDGPWSDPVNLGPEVNSRKWDSAPWLSPDGTALLVNTAGAGQRLFRRVSSREGENTPTVSVEPVTPAEYAGLLSGQWVSALDELARQAAKGAKVPRSLLKKATYEGGVLELEGTRRLTLNAMTGRNMAIRARLTKLGHFDVKGVSHPGLVLRHTNTHTIEELGFYATVLDGRDLLRLGQAQQSSLEDFALARADRPLTDEFEWVLAAIDERLMVYVNGRQVLEAAQRLAAERLCGFRFDQRSCPHHQLRSDDARQPGERRKSLASSSAPSTSLTTERHALFAEPRADGGCRRSRTGESGDEHRAG